MDFSLPKVMGILNLTPDSFYESSRKQTEKEIVGRVVQILEEGADIIDVGACSSRPFAVCVDEAEELKRLQEGLSVIFREAPDAVVSVDTFRAKVARCAVEDFGASIVNDISAGNLDAQMFETVAKLQVPYIATHCCGSPQTMMEHTAYGNLMQEILLYFAERVNQLRQTGVNDIWIDPGFGFSKNTEQNYEVLRRLKEFKIFDMPVLVGFSRKTMIREALNVTAEESLNGTTALNMFALTEGADILRVHDVKEAREAVKLFNCINNKF